MAMATKEQLAELARFSRDTAYFDAHYAELLDRYAEQWVAIYNENVVGVAPDLNELLDRLEREGVPIGQAFVEFLTRSEEIFILPS